MKFWTNRWIQFLMGITISSFTTGLYVVFFESDLTVPSEIVLGKLLLLGALILTAFKHYSSWTWYGMVSHLWGIALLEHLGVVQMSTNQQFVIAGIGATLLGAFVLLDYLNNGVPSRDTPQLT